MNIQIHRVNPNPIYIYILYIYIYIYTHLSVYLSISIYLYIYTSIYHLSGFNPSEARPTAPTRNEHHELLRK